MKKPLKWLSKSRLERANLSIQILAIFLAGVWGIYTFVYKEFYHPTTEEPYVSIKPKIQIVGESDHKYHVLLNLNVENNSKRVVKTFMPTVVLYGIKKPALTHRSERSLNTYFNRLLKEDIVAMLSDKFSTEGVFMKIIGVGTFLNRHEIPHGVKLSHDMLFGVEKLKFEYLLAIIRMPLTGNLEADLEMSYKIEKNSIIADWAPYNSDTNLSDDDSLSYSEEYFPFNEEEDFHEFVSFAYLSLLPPSQTKSTPH